ncbi:MAG TPA: response regulator transcription factor [Miltoncostaeaceae bacterium]|nr:response regulator transcription factor [Miltoncostaeaceae bacterium]
MTDARVTVLIASGSPAFARGLADFLGDPPFTPVVAHGIDAALRDAAVTPPDLAVVDARLADGPGVDLVRELHARHPGTRVLLTVADTDSEAQVEALAAGASGVLLAGWDRAGVREAAADVLRGVSRFDLDVVRALGDVARSAARPDAGLTDQERVVLRLMRQHLTYKEIAQQLGLSWHTVRTHAQSILRKTGVHSRRELDMADRPAGVPAGGVRR